MTTPLTGGSAATPSPHQRLVAALVVALALATGVVLGVAVDRGLLLPGHRPVGGRAPFGMQMRGSHGRGGPPDRMRQHFASELGLSPTQMTQVDSIMSRRMDQRRALEDTLHARVRLMFDSTRADVDRILTPDQRQKFAALRARRDSARPRDHMGSPGEAPKER